MWQKMLQVGSGGGSATKIDLIDKITLFSDYSSGLSWNASTKTFSVTGYANGGIYVDLTDYMSDEYILIVKYKGATDSASYVGLGSSYSWSASGSQSYNKETFTAVANSRRMYPSELAQYWYASGGQGSELVIDEIYILVVNA